MKKAFIMLIGILLCAATSSAVLLPEGTGEIALSGLVDFDSPAGTQIDVSLFYGYYFEDYRQGGLRISVNHNDNATRWALGPRVEQNFDLGFELAPFVAGSLIFTTIDYGHKNALGLGLEGGAKYFLTEYFALSTAIVVELATNRIYPSEGRDKRHNLRLEFGFRTYF